MVGIEMKVSCRTTAVVLGVGPHRGHVIIPLCCPSPCSPPLPADYGVSGDGSSGDQKPGGSRLWLLAIPDQSVKIPPLPRDP